MTRRNRDYTNMTPAKRMQAYRRLQGGRTVGGIQMDAEAAAGLLYLRKQWPAFRSNTEVVLIAVRVLATLTRGGLQRLPVNFVDD